MSPGTLSWPHEGSHLPVWQLCSQTRCPSYLQRHRIMLLEKSDSATSYLGFTTTWSERGGQLKAGDVASELAVTGIILYTSCCLTKDISILRFIHPHSHPQGKHSCSYFTLSTESRPKPRVPWICIQCSFPTGELLHGPDLLETLFMRLSSFI